MRVLILNEKHCKEYFAAPIDKEGVVMLHVIKMRHGKGWYENLEGKEKELLQKCVEEDDFKAAISFFHLRQNAEYEGWDLVDARILPGAQYSYSPLPRGCRDRYEEIERRAKKLIPKFIIGNREDTLVALKKMDTMAAVAVLSEMMMHGPDLRADLNRWLKEVA